MLSNNNDKNEKEGLPSSIDQYYKSQPPVYLISMFELGTAMMGIGMESCYKCHVLHMPAQYARDTSEGKK